MNDHPRSGEFDMPILSRKRISCLFLAAALFLAACSQVTSTPINTEKPNVAYTAAAETIIAQLTEIAGPITQTPQAVTSPVLTMAATEITQPTEAPVAISTSTEALPPVSTTTETETPTPVDTPTETPAPSPTLVAGDPKANLGSPTWRDTFENALNWPLYEDKHVNMQIQNNRLVMTALNADKWDSWMLTWPVLENFYYEITASPGKCKGQDHYGLVARAPEENKTYLFGVSCEGKYSLRKWDGKRMTYLVEWTPSEFILKGANQTNRLGIKADGNTLSLYANGNLLAEKNDNSYKKGGIGVFIGAAETAGFKVRVSEAAYWELP
jgi:hypothetical protein